MSANPINLVLRFLLELAMLAILAVWGWNQSDSWLRFVLAAGVPIAAAALWGVFRFPNDPGPPPVTVPGVVRLAIELFLFGFATWALFDLGAETLGWVFGLVAAGHYLVSYDRVLRLLRNRPESGPEGGPAG